MVPLKFTVGRVEHYQLQSAQSIVLSTVTKKDREKACMRQRQKRKRQQMLGMVASQR